MHPKVGSPGVSELISAARPAPEPLGRGTALQPALPVLKVAEPVALKEPICFTPGLPIVTSFAIAFMRSCVVSEPTPTSARGDGAPVGSAWAAPMPKRLVTSPALMAAKARRFLEITAVPFDDELPRAEGRRPMKRRLQQPPGEASRAHRRGRCDASAGPLYVRETLGFKPPFGNPADIVRYALCGRSATARARSERIAHRLAR